MNQNEPLVSILIPVYGVERYITRCLESVARQTYKNLEVILVDDCTPDKSIEIAKNYINTSSLRDKTRIIYHENNLGLSAARNTAVAVAKGDYVLHLDSDDLIKEDTVSEVVSVSIENNADAVLFGFTHRYGTFDTIELLDIPDTKVDYLKLLLERNTPVCLCGGLYSRHLYVDNGIEELEGYDYEEDYVTKPRLLYYANKIISVAKPFYVYNHINESSMTRTFKSKCIEDTVVTMLTLRNFYEGIANAENYNKSLDIASLKLKANLLRNWSLNNGGNEDWKTIKELFSSVSLSMDVGAKEFLSLTLAKMNMPLILRLYNIIGNRVMYHLKQMSIKL